MAICTLGEGPPLPDTRQDEGNVRERMKVCTVFRLRNTKTFTNQEETRQRENQEHSSQHRGLRSASENQPTSGIVPGRACKPK
jgi:hypothetical protein